MPNRPTARGYTLSYRYDRLYRLTSAGGGLAGYTTCTYDPVGNRLTRTRNSTSQISYAYDKEDRITAAGATGYTVNAVGNMTARGSDTLAYDQANRLTSTTVGSTTATYAYDGDGKRASKTVSSTTSAYVYDSNRGLPVLLEDGTRRYVWGLGLAYEVEGSAALVYHVDGLGSVRALTDSTKAVVQTYESDEFGVPITSQGGSGQPFGFTGEQRDPEAGLIYLRARLLDPVIGRFISADPRRGKIQIPSLLNRYAYVTNNPCNHVDPAGLTPTVSQDSLAPYGPGETRLFRGTDRAGEIAVYERTGILFSDAGRQAYFETGNVNSAFWSTVSAYERTAAMISRGKNQVVQEILGHAAPDMYAGTQAIGCLHVFLGTQYRRMVGEERVLVSATKSLDAAMKFAGDNGTVFTGCIPNSNFIESPISSVDNEVLVRYWIRNMTVFSSPDPWGR